MNLTKKKLEETIREVYRQAKEADPKSYSLVEMASKLQNEEVLLEFQEAVEKAMKNHLEKEKKRQLEHPVAPSQSIATPRKLRRKMNGGILASIGDPVDYPASAESLRILAMPATGIFYMSDGTIREAKDVPEEALREYFMQTGSTEITVNNPLHNGMFNTFGTSVLVDSADEDFPRQHFEQEKLKEDPEKTENPRAYYAKKIANDEVIYLNNIAEAEVALPYIKGYKDMMLAIVAPVDVITYIQQELMNEIVKADFPVDEKPRVQAGSIEEYLEQSKEFFNSIQ